MKNYGSNGAPNVLVWHCLREKTREHRAQTGTFAVPQKGELGL